MKSPFLGFAVLLCASTCLAEEPKQLSLSDWGPGFDVKALELHSAKAAVGKNNLGPVLQVTYLPKTKYPGVVLKAAKEPWNLASFGQVAVAVKNTGKQELRVGLRLDSVGSKTWLQQTTQVPPGESREVRVALRQRLPEGLEARLFGMRGYPGGASAKGVDPAAINRVTLFTSDITAEQSAEMSPIVASGAAPVRVALDEKTLFPMIDTFGQFRHTDWPGKIHTIADLQQRKSAEVADLAAHPGPDGWGVYGGWKSGPQLKATGFFRVEKYQGKWWMVDPDGRLFWSHGIDCVRSSTGTTPITDRKHWFADLPDKAAPLAQFYGRGQGAAHGYYEKLKYETFNFTAANLLRKYGDNWPEQHRQLAHQRMRSWGLNSIGSWSDPDIYGLRKTPYTVMVNVNSRPIEANTGYWGKFSDAFDPSFRENLRGRMAKEKGVSVGDPWCLGYFSGNELAWGDEFSLALDALASPATQPAKIAFVDDLKRKYHSIDKLNAAWGTPHASWDALLADRTKPDRKRAAVDLGDFYTRFAEQFFRVCRASIKEAAPNALYIGCRFAWSNERAVRAAAKYCDIVSFNRYQDTIENSKLPDGVDMPTIIGEFHFGALDRGMFHTGLRPVADQNARAQAYERYVRGALRQPSLVGTHWFQFGDQATTGRSDGENYQIGFLDVCDTPYAETIAASRAIGATMYRFRAEAK